VTTLEVVTQPASTRGALEALFHPRSIAFIGASERPNAPASRGLRHCIRLGFRGGLYPVNPKYPSLFGARCYPSLDSAPAPIDLAMIALGADATLEAVAACQKAGVKVVVACSSGWDEIGPAGAQRAAKLRKVLEGSPMRLLGPNCLGSGNPALGMCLAYNSSFESVTFPRRGPIGLVTQSGAMLGGIVLNSEDVGADIGLFAHVGNAMDIGMEEIMEHMILDPAITVLALMIEGVRQPARFVAAARKARAAGKPVVAFKAGASEIGRRAVLSHTGALAGADEVFSAVCREEGIIRVDEPEDLMQAAQLMASWRREAPPGGGRLLVYTLSGGAASIMADECATVGVTLPELTESTLSRLSAMLPSYTRASNPLDVGGGVFSDPDLPRKSLAIAVEDGNVDAVVWIGVGAPRDERSKTMLGEALEIMKDCRIPGAVIPVSGYPEEPGFDGARQKGIPVLRSLRSAAKLIAHAMRANRALPARGTVQGDVPELPAGHVIDEARAKQTLARLGIPVPESRVAARREDVSGLAREVGFPVVVKGLVEGVTHKSEAGLVALGLATAEAADDAAARMMGCAGRKVRGFLVERMVGGGVEVVLGIKRDPEFGQVLMFGLGGVAVELFRDVAFATCPLGVEGARELIGLTRAAKLLGRYRGRVAADEEALVEAMVRLSQFAARHGAELDEMDVNPLVVLPKGQGVVALDAVIVRRRT
jgi:acetate---CoA ligase (ADP-forming)